MKRAFPLMLLAAAAAASVDPGAVFDGRKTSAGASAPALSGEAPALGRGEAKATPVPDDLAAAKARWGNEAALARLAAAPGAPDRVSLAVIGDAEPGRFFWERWWNSDRKAFVKQVTAVQSSGAEFIVQLGDLVSRGTAKNFREGVGLLEKTVTAPMLHVQGNHDRSQPNGEADKDLFRAVFGPGDYLLDRGGWRFVVLDSADYALTDAQLDWLDRALDTDLPALVFMHIPPKYLSGKIRSQGPKQDYWDKLAERENKDDEAPFLSGWMEGGSARFGQIMAHRRPERVYMGHIHAFGTAEVDGVKYVLSGGGGSPLYPLPPGYPTRRKLHYIRLDAGPGGSLTETVHELDGTVFPISW